MIAKAPPPPARSEIFPAHNHLLTRPAGMSRWLAGVRRPDVQVFVCPACATEQQPSEHGVFSGCASCDLRWQITGNSLAIWRDEGSHLQLLSDATQEPTGERLSDDALARLLSIAEEHGDSVGVRLAKEEQDRRVPPPETKQAFIPPPPSPGLIPMIEGGSPSPQTRALGHMSETSLVCETDGAAILEEVER